MSVHRDPVEKPAPLTDEEFQAQWQEISRKSEELAAQGQALWARHPRQPAVDEAPADEGLILPDYLPDGKPLPTFSVSVQADGLEVRLRDQAAVGKGVEELIQTITPAVSLACAEEVRTLIERIEEEYRGVIEPLCAEIRRLRDHLAAGYLGHADNLVPSMDELEKTESGVELEDELDELAKKEQAEITAEVTKRAAAQGLQPPQADVAFVEKIGTGELTPEQWAEYEKHDGARQKYHNALETLRRTVIQERRDALADSGMV